MSLLDQILEDLRKEYISQIPQKVAQIETLAKLNDWILLRNEFHKLKGTGKTYGVPEITEIGAIVEFHFAQSENLNGEDSIPLLDSKKAQIAQNAVAALKKIFNARSLGRAYDLTTCEYYNSLLKMK